MLTLDASELLRLLDADDVDDDEAVKTSSEEGADRWDEDEPDESDEMGEVDCLLSVEATVTVGVLWPAVLDPGGEAVGMLVSGCPAVTAAGAGADSAEPGVAGVTTTGARAPAAVTAARGTGAFSCVAGGTIMA